MGMWKTMLIIFALASSAAAYTNIQTEIHCTGDCNISETLNNKTVAIESNGSLEWNSSVENTTMNLTVASNGTGKIETNGSGKYEANISIDNHVENAENQDGFFHSVFEFFRSLSLFAWLR